MSNPPDKFISYDFSSVTDRTQLSNALGTAVTGFFNTYAVYPNIFFLDMSVTKSLQLGYYA